MGVASWRFRIWEWRVLLDSNLADIGDNTDKDKADRGESEGFGWDRKLQREMGEYSTCY